MPWRAILFGICLVFVALSVCYVRETPYRTAGLLATNHGAPAQDIGAPDERQHANYVMRLANGEGFPVFDAKDPNLYENYQSHQPPAYYLITAGVVKLTGSNLSLPDEGFSLRLLSTVFGVLTILGVFFAVRWGLGNDEAALSAAAICAFLPMFVALNSAISNDPMLFCLCTWTLALCALMIREGWCLKRSILLGVLVGVALLTKTTALALLPTVFVAMMFSRRSSQVSRFAWAALAIPILIALPWWLRNHSLYGDPFAMGAFRQAFTGSAQASSFIESFGAFEYWTNWVGWWTMRSFVGTFGYMDIFLPDTLYRLVFALFALCLLGWALQKNRKDETQPPDPGARVFTLTCWTLFVVVLLLFLQFNMTYFQAQARYLYPAIGAIAAGVGVGACALLRNFSKWSWAALAVIFVSLNVYVLMRLPDDFAKRTVALQSMPTNSP